MRPVIVPQSGRLGNHEKLPELAMSGRPLLWVMHLIIRSDLANCVCPLRKNGPSGMAAICAPRESAGGAQRSGCVKRVS